MSTLVALSVAVVSAAALTAPWRAWLAPRVHAYCDLDPHGPLGCGDTNTYAFVDHDVETSAHNVEIYAGFAHRLVVLPFTPGQTGSVDLEVISD